MSGYRELAAAVGLVGAVAAGIPVRAQPQQPAPTVAVVGFALASGAKLGTKETDALAEAMAVKLVESGRYRVLDREWLGIKNGAKPLPLGRVREAAKNANVDFLIVGRIEKFRATYQYGAGPAFQQRAPFGMPYPMRYPPVRSRGATRSRYTESLRVTIDVIDPETGNSITKTSSTCPVPKPRASMFVKAIAPVSPLAAIAVIADSRRPLIDPGLERALTAVTQTLLSWRGPAVAGK